MDMKMKFDKKTIFVVVVLIFLGILLFMYFKNARRGERNCKKGKRESRLKYNSYS